MIFSFLFFFLICDLIQFAVLNAYDSTNAVCKVLQIPRGN